MVYNSTELVLICRGAKVFKGEICTFANFLKVLCCLPLLGGEQNIDF